MIISERILKNGGHADGDPGREIENLTTPGCQEEFYVRVDPDLLPMEANEGRYPAKIFRTGVKSILLEYLVVYPNQKDEVNIVLAMN